MPTRSNVIPILVCAAVTISLAGVVRAEAPEAGAGAEQAAPADANGEPRIESVAELLAALEKSDEGLLALSAEIQHYKKFKLQDDEQMRRGKLAFVSEPSNAPPGGGRAKRSFAITFEDLIVGDTLTKDPQIWIFDGQWLIEKRPKQKQFIKRRIAPPNADFDPLRIGEGTLPIPIGQKAADILKRYDVELRAAKDGVEPKMEGFVEGTKQLRLVPKAERAEEDEFTELRLWYRWDAKSGRYLPRLARTTGRGGDESDIQLIKVAVRIAGRAGDANIPAGAFDTTPPADGDGWDVQVVE